MELRPCPFCGGKAHVQRHIVAGLPDTFGVVCLVCGAQSVQLYDTPEDAAESWNKSAACSRNCDRCPLPDCEAREVKNAIMCKDCKFHVENDENELWCERWGWPMRMLTKYAYCSYAKPKEEETL